MYAPHQGMDTSHSKNVLTYNEKCKVHAEKGIHNEKRTPYNGKRKPDKVKQHLILNSSLA